MTESKIRIVLLAWDLLKYLNKVCSQSICTLWTGVVLHEVAAPSIGACHVLLWPLTVLPAGASLWRRFLMMRRSVLIGYTSSTKRRYGPKYLKTYWTRYTRYILLYMNMFEFDLLDWWELQFIPRPSPLRMHYKSTMRRRAVSPAPPSYLNVEFGLCWTSCFGLLSCFLRLLTLPGMSLSAALPSSSLASWSSSLSVSCCFLNVISK